MGVREEKGDGVEGNHQRIQNALGEADGVQSHLT